jgi:hypothetical protein
MGSSEQAFPKETGCQISGSKFGRKLPGKM